MKNKILLALLNSEDFLTMSEIAEKTKSDIQLCNYHLKKMVTDDEILCKEKDGKKLYYTHPIIKESQLYEAVLYSAALAVPEFFEATKDKKKTIKYLRQTLLQVLNTIEEGYLE